jgi:hypothetical protein
MKLHVVVRTDHGVEALAENGGIFIDLRAFYRTGLEAAAG